MKTKSTIYSQRWQQKNPWKHKFIQSKGNAKHRSIPFLLTFDEWQRIWLESGKWEQRGWRKGQYVMARFGDKGAYEIGNVKICLAEENRQERNTNYPMKGENNSAYGKDYWATGTDAKRAIRAAKVSAQFKGVPKSEAQRAKMGRSFARFLVTEAGQEYLTAARARTTGRRLVVRDGKRGWSYPGDADYPKEAQL